MITEQNMKEGSGLRAHAEMRAVPWYVKCSLHRTKGSWRKLKYLKNTAIKMQALRRMLFIQTKIENLDKEKGELYKVFKYVLWY